MPRVKLVATTVNSRTIGAYLLNLTQFALNVAYGVAIGTVLGLTGSGGSILTVPVLVYLVGQDVHTAVSTSLAVVGGIATEGFVGQRDNVQWKAGLWLGVCGMAGSVGGSLLSSYVSGPVLLLLFAGIMIVASIIMLRADGANMPQGRAAPLWNIVVAGLGIGFLTGFFGVGGGFLIVPTMVFTFGSSMRMAIATSLLVIGFNSFVGIFARVATAAVDWSVVGALLAGGFGGSAAASILVRRLDQRRLKKIFAVFILLVGLFTAASTLGVIPIGVK